MKLDEHIDSDASENDEQYENLAKAVSQLDSSQRIKAATRKELSTVVSEFHLPGGNVKAGNLVDVSDLVKVIRNKKEHALISKKIKNISQQAKTLPKPLEKPVAERIKRSTGYQNVTSQLKKWNAVVEKNRVAEQLSFPLNQSRITLQSSDQFLSKFKNETPLEKQISEVLNAGKTEDETEKESQDQLEFPMTLEEIMEKRKEMAQFRAKMSYREAKAYRQSKIKSKKYHRILKREKIKQQLKEFEQLQKSDPHAALKKLEELDKTRAYERASLRHKNTGKWAKNIAVRAKYDKESRKVLAEQLKLSRDLTEKVKHLGSDDDASDRENGDDNGQWDLATKDDNPWAIKTSSDVSDFVSDFRKYWTDINKSKELENKIISKGESCETEPPNLNFKNRTSDLSDLPVTCNQNPSFQSDPSCKLENFNESSQPCVPNVKNSTGQVNGTKDASELKNSLKSKKDKSSRKGRIVKSNLENSLNSSVANGQCKKSSKCLSTTDTDYSENTLNVLEKKTGHVESPVASVNSSRTKIKTKTNKIPKRDMKNKSVKKESKKHKEQIETDCRAEVSSASGVWIVSSVADNKPQEANCKGTKRKIPKDIDDLFENLEEKILKKTNKKLKIISRRLQKPKKLTNRRKKKGSDDSEVESDVDLSMKKNPKHQRPEMDLELVETAGKEPYDLVTNDNSNIATITELEEVEESQRPPEIDPNKFIEVKAQKLHTKLPDDMTGDDFMDDDETTQRMDIVEAFEADDVMEEFQEMKKKEEESTKLELPQELPGWGSWGGTGIKKRKRRIRRKPSKLKLPKRKDHGKKDMIIRETANKNAVEHMVKEVPYPFASVGAFEANVRNPIGREWVPESAHRKFIEKPVETTLGMIIDPMDENELVRLKKESKSLYRGIQKS